MEFDCYKPLCADTSTKSVIGATVTHCQSDVRCIVQQKQQHHTIYSVDRAAYTMYLILLFITCEAEPPRGDLVCRPPVCMVTLSSCCFWSTVGPVQGTGIPGRTIDISVNCESIVRGGALHHVAATAADPSSLASATRMPHDQAARSPRHTLQQNYPGKYDTNDQAADRAADPP